MALQADKQREENTLHGGDDHPYKSDRKELALSDVKAHQRPRDRESQGRNQRQADEENKSVGALCGGAIPVKRDLSPEIVWHAERYANSDESGDRRENRELAIPLITEVAWYQCCCQ